MCDRAGAVLLDVGVILFPLVIPNGLLYNPWNAGGHQGGHDLKLHPSRDQDPLLARGPKAVMRRGVNEFRSQLD